MIMQINAAIVENHQRMALAYEMVHLLNGDVDTVYLWAERSSFRGWVDQRQERRASLSAVHILIPPWAIGQCDSVADISLVCDAPVELVELLIEH